MSNQRIVVLGANGMLGSDVMAEFAKAGIEAKGFDLPQFDITDIKRLGDIIEQADAVINCAAYTDVEKAQTEAELAHTINADAVGRLAHFAWENQTWVLHISTDFVFDGQKKTPYVEEDVPNPINEYGKSKLAGEEQLILSGCPYCIMRVEWTYGDNGNNFVKKLVSLTNERDSIGVVDDQIGSPTATVETAKVIRQLIDKKPQGIYHYAADGYVSRYDMAKYIFEKLNINTKVEPCKSSNFKTAAQRPLNSRFNCDKIKRILDEPIPDWQKQLDDFLGKLK
ncbi:MAG: dTDP-4-dehydrorhamnose reductase [Phycisphaerae bacterium]|nr:dTDP-4-dehydrorhamnose reductase [Phycisphaerae bacterium]